MTVTAVVLAGGVGRRLGGPAPKQLIEVAARPILAYSIEAFDAAPEIDEVIVVMAEGHEDSASDIARPFAKVRAVISGGDSRTESTLRALEVLADASDDARVLFHDAARPFVDAGIIARCVEALRSFDAVAVAVPTADTIVEVAGDEVVAMPPRESLRRFQTPQGFRLGTLRKAYDLALADPSFSATDDCGVVHRYLPGVPIRVVSGDERNLKVTHPLDLVIAEHLAAHPPRRAT
ncbi:MAG TPA: 2-C-methyl-D-erythritol 4-phosphate cytidylyltransferase [Streptosporangiaceae bacterium]|nr:2-C-methyl-D-erythritol 4-phosphate cytidylyltransferase [Streptosporangiaceae bacterium]